MLGKLINERSEPGLVFEQGGDVVKENALFGKVGDFANEVLQLIGI